MSKKYLKILVPFVAILYCIAFFELEIGNVEQTWGDQYDTYITASYSTNMGASFDPPAKPDLTFTPFHFFRSWVAPQLRTASSPNKAIEEVIPSQPLRLFIRNCTWLI